MSRPQKFLDVKEDMV